MRSRNNPRRNYVDMMVASRPSNLAPQHTSQHVSAEIEQAIIQKHYRRLLAKRIRRVARVAVVASKNNLTVRQLRVRLFKRQTKQALHTVHANQYRIMAAGFVLLFGISSVLTPLIQANHEKQLSLDAATSKLVGDTRDDSRDYLKFDGNRKLYTFEAPAQDASSVHNHTGRNADSYTATLPNSPKDGIVVTDTKSNIAVTLTPEFFTTSIKKTDGDHLVYMSGSRKLIYTLKYNGLKEDIVIPKYQGPNMSYNFTLQLPSGVEARMDGEGNIGIYSADLSLYGNMTFSNEADRAKVDKARENSEKTNLVMTIPYPVIRDASGAEYTDRAEFVLGNKKTAISKQQDPKLPPDAEPINALMNTYSLRLSASKLQDLAYPLSIDPTMQVTNSADFSKMNDDSGSTIDTTNNLIKRSSLTGGGINFWGTGINTKFTTPRFGQATATYNGFIYVIGGCKDTTFFLSGGCSAANTISDISYASISNGNVGNYASTTPLNSGRYYVAAIAYDGYLYVLGGSNSGTTAGTNTVQYVHINTNGTLDSTWHVANNMPDNLFWASAVTYNGKIYILGGRDASSSNHVRYATINGDGSLSSWSAGPNMNSLRGGGGFVQINGYIYATGGNSNGGTVNNTTEYSAIQSDGSLSNWTVSTSFTTSRYTHTAFRLGNYIYIAGGCTGSTTGFDCSGIASDTQYAPVYTDGSVGKWLQTSAINASRWLFTGTQYDGYAYYTGGCLNTTCGSLSNDTYSGKSLPAGVLGSTNVSGSGATHSASLPYAGQGIASAVEDGFLYIAGGQSTAQYENHIYHTKLNTDGTFSYPGDGANGKCTAVSTYWCDDGLYTGAALIKGFAGSSMVIAKHCMMLIGGVNASGTTNNVYMAPIAFSGSTGGAGASSNDGQIGTVVVANNKPTARAYGAASYYKGFIFYAGGINGTTYQSIIQNTFITNSNCSLGSLTTWNTEAIMSTPRAYLSTYRRQNHLYFIGGYSGSASLLSSGEDLDTGTSNTTFSNALSTPLAGFGLAESNGSVYIVGGTTGSSSVDGNTRRLAAGTTTRPASTDWSTDPPPSSPAPSGGVNRNVVIAANGFLYSLGGCTAGATNATCTGFTSTIYYSTINNGGGGSMQATNSSVTWGTRKSSTTYASNGYFYSIGGCPQGVDCSSTGTPASMSTTVSYTKINSDGSLNNCNGSGGWCDLTGVNDGALPECRTNGSALTLGNYIYYFGGFSDCAAGTPSTNVLYAAVNPTTGALSKPNATCTLHNATTSTIWCDTATLPTSYNVFNSAHKHGVVYNNIFYVYDPVNANTAYIAHNPANGDLVTPSGCATTFTSSLYCQTTSPFSTSGIGFQDGPLNAYHDRMYIIGGSDGGPNVNSASAPINSDGSMGTWRRENVMPFTRNASQAAIVDGFAYSLFGYDGGDIMVNCYMGLLRAPILADGTLGEWQSYYHLTDQYASGEAIVAGHKIYSFNGSCGNPNVVQPPMILTPQTMFRKAEFSKLYDFETGVKPTKLITRGTKQGGASMTSAFTSSNNTLTPLSNSQSLGELQLGGANGRTLNLGTNITLSRYLYLRYIVDDSQSAVFPDTGTESTVTDFDMYYISNPGSRLRGGRTFTNGVDRGLDAQPQ